MFDNFLERDRGCATCKHLYFTKKTKCCGENNRYPNRVIHPAYCDFCENYEPKIDEATYKNVFIDEEKDCYIYKFTIDGKEEIVYADSKCEIWEMQRKLHNIRQILQGNTRGNGFPDALDFYKFMRNEIPDVYRKLRMEYAKQQRERIGNNG